MFVKEDIKKYYVYDYYFIDYNGGFLKPEDVFLDFEHDFDLNLEELPEIIEEVKKLFLKKGWEGDGNIGLIWIPPFINIGYERDYIGNFFWHVKQQNNGTSFIASPLPLSFEYMEA